MPAEDAAAAVASTVVSFEPTRAGLINGGSDDCDVSEASGAVVETLPPHGPEGETPSPSLLSVLLRRWTPSGRGGTSIRQWSTEPKAVAATTNEESMPK